MSQVKIGDEIWTTQKFAKVTAWLHYEPENYGQFLKVQDSMNSSFTASAKHNLATEDGEYIFAEETINRKLFGSKYEIKTV